MMGGAWRSSSTSVSRLDGWKLESLCPHYGWHVFFCAAEPGGHAGEHSRVLCPDSMTLQPSAQRMFLHARTCADFRERATHAQAFVYVQARTLAYAKLTSQGMGAMKAACGIPARDLRLTEGVLCQFKLQRHVV